MKDIGLLKERYLNFMEERKTELKANIMNLNEQRSSDESNLEKIKLNIVEIFQKMFNISLKDEVELEKKYLEYFNKIMEPWQKNQKDALSYEDTKVVIIEELKIREAEGLKNKFIELHNEMVTGGVK